MGDEESPGAQRARLLATIDPCHETVLAEDMAARSLHRGCRLVAADDAVVADQGVQAFEFGGQEVFSRWERGQGTDFDHMRMEKSLVHEVQPHEPDSDAGEEGGWVVEKGVWREEEQDGGEEGVHCDGERLGGVAVDCVTGVGDELEENAFA